MSDPIQIGGITLINLLFFVAGMLCNDKKDWLKVCLVYILLVGMVIF
jgi:hypothetical protein